MVKLNYKKPVTELVELESAGNILTNSDSVMVTTMSLTTMSVDDTTKTTTLQGGTADVLDDYGNKINEQPI